MGSAVCFLAMEGKLQFNLYIRSGPIRYALLQIGIGASFGRHNSIPWLRYRYVPINMKTLYDFQMLAAFRHPILTDLT